MDDVVGFLSQLTYWHWFALGAGLLLLEIFTPTFYFIWPGIAAVLVGVLKLAIPEMSWGVSLTIFGLLSVAAIVIWHAFYKKGPSDAVDTLQLNRRAGRYVGRRAVVAEAFRGGRGPILLDDTRWQAVSDTGADLQPGSSVEITGADGAILHVRAA